MKYRDCNVGENYGQGYCDGSGFGCGFERNGLRYGYSGYLCDIDDNENFFARCGGYSSGRGSKNCLGFAGDGGPLGFGTASGAGYTDQTGRGG